jgi:glycosyltransferase involved in cell wall biosynthesis
LNIVHVVESMDRGGLERVVCDLAQEQRRTGHRVSIVCLFNDGLLAEEARQSGVSVIVVRKKTGIDLAALMKLRRAVKACDADVIHTHNATAHYHAALVGARRGRTILVNTRHGMGGPRTSDRRERFFSLALGRTAAVAAVCQAAARRLVADRIAPANLVSVVPNGIRLHAFGNQDSLDARQRFDLPEDALVVGTVGRLNWAKDHAFLLQVFQEFARNAPSAFLVIIGEGEQREALVRLTAELALEGRVRFLGDRPDVALLLPGMDIFALSSRTEGYSIALLEACAAGIAIVATDVGGNREIIQDQVTGLLVEHGNPASFANALARLAESTALRAQFGTRARAWATANASLETMAERYERLYSDCGAASGSAPDQTRLTPRLN